MKFIYVFLLLFTLASPILGQSASIDEINTQVNEGNLLNALSLAETALLDNPKDYDLLTYQARLNLWIKNWEQSEIQINKLLTGFPNNEEIQKLHLKYLEWSNKWSGLKLYSEKYYQQDQSNSDYLRSYVLALIQLNEFEESKLHNLKKLQLEELYYEKKQANYSIELESNLYVFQENLSHWSINSIRLKRRDRIPFNLQATYANRFNENGIQIGGSIYPKLGKTMEGALELNYSRNAIFPTIQFTGSLSKSISNFNIGGGTAIRKFNAISSTSPFLTVYYYTKNSISNFKSTVNIIGKNHAYGFQGQYSRILSLKHQLTGKIAYGNYLEYIILNDGPSLISYQSTSISYNYTTLNKLITTIEVGYIKESSQESWERKAWLFQLKTSVPFQNKNR